MLGHTPEERGKARELADRMQELYGDGWRDLVIAGPLGSFRLVDVFAESGLIDPEQVPVVPSRSHGLWQVASGVPIASPPPPTINDALRRLRETAASVHKQRFAPWDN